MCLLLLYETALNFCPVVPGLQEHFSAESTFDSTQ